MATHLLPAPPVTLTKSSSRRSLSTRFLSPSGTDFSAHAIRSPSRGKRGGALVTMARATKRPPPDLASHLFANRIVYMGMVLVPEVTELIVAEFIYLNYESDTKPMYFYINSTGTTKDGVKYGYETEAFAIYDTMQYMVAPVFTLCVGNAWGEAALLLAAGAKGNRSALPSSTIMMKQPIARFQGQATDVELKRREMRRVKADLVKLYAKSIGKSPEQIEADIRRPKYFSPSEAVEYGIIDKVVYNERGKQDKGVATSRQSI